MIFYFTALIPQAVVHPLKPLEPLSSTNVARNFLNGDTLQNVQTLDGGGQANFWESMSKGFWSSELLKD